LRKDLSRVNEKDLHDTLARLGYVKCKKNGSEWRCRQFHIFLKHRKKRGISIRIHEDTPHYLPPFHRAKQKGKALAQEMNKIVEAYKRRRALS